MFNVVLLWTAIFAFSRTTVKGKSFGIENPEVLSFESNSSSVKNGAKFDFEVSSLEMGESGKTNWDVIPEYEHIDYNDVTNNTSDVSNANNTNDVANINDIASTNSTNDEANSNDTNNTNDANSTNDVANVAPLFSADKSSVESTEATTMPELAVIKNESSSEVEAEDQSSEVDPVPTDDDSGKASSEAPSAADSGEEDPSDEKSSECRGLTLGQFSELQTVCDECYDLHHISEVYTFCRSS